jgi:hypothetical protein
MDAGPNRIRLYSRLAAMALAAIAVVGALALRVPREEERYGSLTITSYIVDLTPTHRETPPQKPPPPQHPPQPATAFLSEPSSDAPPRLWSYNTVGQIVFDRPEQYRRCLEARAAHHNEADCPEPHDAHPLVLRPG